MPLSSSQALQIASTAALTLSVAVRCSVSGAASARVRTSSSSLWMWTTRFRLSAGISTTVSVSIDVPATVVSSEGWAVIISQGWVGSESVNMPFCVGAETILQRCDTFHSVCGRAVKELAIRGKLWTGWCIERFWRVCERSRCSTS